MLRLSKCLLGPVFTALLFTATNSAQSPQPAPPSASQQQPSQPNITTLHATTQLVVVDVVVTDKHGNPVHNLKASDFTLLENQAPQQIKSFDEHAAVSATDKLPSMPVMPPGVFTNFSFAPNKGATNILLLDMLNTPVSDQVYARAEIKKYIDHASPTNRIAIFGLSYHLILLQGFTSDPTILKAAIDKKNSRPSNLLADSVVGGTAAPTASETFRDSGAADEAKAAIALANLEQFDAQQQAIDQQLQVKYTLDALNQLARSLAGIPGRKNLLWFSGSFPLRIMADIDAATKGPVLPDPYAVLAGSEDEFHETINLLTRSQIAVYPIDARGVLASSVNTATTANPAYAHIDGAHSAIHQENQFDDKTIGEHVTMMQMAEGTGGQAYINSNDLTQGVAKSIEAGANYYTLSYSPSDTTQNGAFRKIQVKLQQQGLTLAYRRGYYANATSDIAKKLDHATGASANTGGPLAPMRAAMMYGGPLPTEIVLKVRVLPATSEPEAELASNNKLNPKLKFDGPYRRFAIDYAASPREVVFTRSPEGNYEGDVEFQTYVYDQDGKLFNVVENRRHASLSASDYADLMRSGIPWRQEVSVPVKGDYYLRIGVHDLTSNRVAAVEVPVATVKNLPPAPTPTAPATPSATEAKPQ